MLDALSVQLKSSAQVALLATSAHEVDPPKLQVVLPAKGVGLEVLNVVVPADTNPTGAISTLLLPAGTVKAPRLGREAGLPVWVRVPVHPAVYGTAWAASAQALIVKVLLAQVLPLTGPLISKWCGGVTHARLLTTMLQLACRVVPLALVHTKAPVVLTDA